MLCICSYSLLRFSLLSFTENRPRRMSGRTWTTTVPLYHPTWPRGWRLSEYRHTLMQLHIHTHTHPTHLPTHTHAHTSYALTPHTHAHTHTLRTHPTHTLHTIEHPLPLSLHRALKHIRESVTELCAKLIEFELKVQPVCVCTQAHLTAHLHSTGTDHTFCHCMRTLLSLLHYCHSSPSPSSPSLLLIILSSPPLPPSPPLLFLPLLPSLPLPSPGLEEGRAS